MTITASRNAISKVTTYVVAVGEYDLMVTPEHAKPFLSGDASMSDLLLGLHCVAVAYEVRTSAPPPKGVTHD